VHGNEAGRKERTIFVSVDLLEDQAEHRSIDQGFILLLDVFASLATKVIGIKKFKEIFQRSQSTATLFPFRIFQNRSRANGQLLFVPEVAYKNSIMLHLSRLE